MMNLVYHSEGNTLEMQYISKYGEFPSHYGHEANKEMKKFIFENFELKNIKLGCDEEGDEQEEDEEEEGVKASVRAWGKLFGTLGGTTSTSGTYYHKERRVMASVNKTWINCYFHLDELEFVKQLQALAKKPEEESKAKVFLLCNQGHGFYLKRSNLFIDNFDVEKAYGSKFMPFYNNILPKLQSKNTGVVLLHGAPGSGKTSLVKYLTSVIDRKFVIVPNYMIEELSSPYMIPFLMDNPEIVLILEDAEAAILSREDGNRGPVAELLNLSDGLIGEAVRCSIIVTFNTDIARIDKALKRKGRLLGEYNFEALSVEDANALLSYLGKTYKATSPMLLTDVYNIDEELIKQNDIEYNKIGFR